MRILLDQDGPLAGFDNHFWKVATDAGYEFEIDSLSNQKHRYVTDHIDEDVRTAARNLTHTAGFFREFPIVEGALEGVDRLLSAGHDVWVCTKPLEANTTCHSDKFAWITEHFPSLKYNIIITPDKSLIKGDILLDDGIKLEWIPKAEWIPVVFSYPWNGEGSEWEGLPRWDWSHDVSELEYIFHQHQELKRRGYNPNKFNLNDIWELL